jgi:hypothetical protein
MVHQHRVLAAAFDVLAPHTIMAHAKDVVESNGEIRHVAAGRGQLDYSVYLSLLRQVRAVLSDCRTWQRSNLGQSIRWRKANQQRENADPYQRRMASPCRKQFLHLVLFRTCGPQE